MSYRNSSSVNPGQIVFYGAILLVVVFGCAIMLFAGDMFGYAWHRVGENQIGVELKESRVIDVKGPGIYNAPFSWWADIVDVKVEGVQFTAKDDEVLTKDQQRIGLTVSGTVHRPDIEDSTVYFELWNQYRTLFTNDEALVGTTDEEGNLQGGLMLSLSQQAMKVCVGDRNFTEAVVGAARDVLKECISSEINELAVSYGLTVRNVLVPNVILGTAVQGLLDEITQARFETDVEEQRALRAEAETNRQLAEQQGQIRVEQGMIQETRKQEAITADLERQALVAQKQVIEARKANELQEAQLNLEISEANKAVADVEAQASLAKEAAKAKLFDASPGYLEYMRFIAAADAWSDIDKVIVPAGTSINSILDPDGDFNSVIDVTGQ